jgi:putative hemolysin
LSPLLFYLILLIILLGLSVFFSAAETAYMAVNRVRLKYKADAGDKKAEALKGIVSNPDRLLGVLLFGVTVAEIASASLVTYIISNYLVKDHSEVFSFIGSILFAIVVLIFCELTPKIIAAVRPEQTATALLLPVKITIWLLFPLARSAAWIANGVVRIIGMHSVASPFAHSLSEDDIKAMIAGSTEAAMPDGKKAMLHNIFEIGATQVREIMIPRVEVTAVEIGDEISKILEVINKTNYSRIPVYRQNFDNPIGILYVKDLLQYIQKAETINLQVLLRPVHFIPDSARLDIVLRQLQSMHLHMAVVVDEFGGVEGIVTLEDLLEEIVGEIRDEHDTEMELIRELGPNLFSIAGNLPVKDFNRFFEQKIPEAQEYTTVAGFLEALTGRLLLEGESVRYQDFILTVEKTEGFRIVSVRIRSSAPKPDKTAGSKVKKKAQD